MSNGMYEVLGLSYLIGSHMYGLTTNSSDEDTLTVYFEPDDYLLPRPFREHPLVQESHGNNTKLYSLDYFAELTVKGNPNLVEVVTLKPTYVGDESGAVQDFMNLMSSSNILVHDGVARAYMGHLNGIVKELHNRGVTAKRLSHALRVVYSVEHIVTTQTLFRLPDHEEKRKLCLEIKLAGDTDKYVSFVLDEIARVESVYERYVGSMRDNSRVKREVKDFFQNHLYTFNG